MNKKSKVILLPCNSYREEIVYENLEIGLELLGGIENIVGKEESVLLKPNLLKKAEDVYKRQLQCGACYGAGKGCTWSY